MLFLVLAVLLCVLVPLLSVLVWRWVPRRPPDPPAAASLHSLAAELHPSLLHEDLVEAEPSADITRPAETTPPATRARPTGPVEDGEPIRDPETNVIATDKAK